MKSKSEKSARGGVLRPVLFAILACVVPILLAETPSWWTERGVVRLDAAGNPVEAKDYAAANQGQLKELAVSAYEEFLAKIPAELGGIGAIVPPPNPSQPESPTNRASPGWRIRQIISQWVVLTPNGTVQRDTNGKRVLVAGATSQKDFAVITQGQLKAVAAPFYDRLAELFWSFNRSTPSTSQIDPKWAKPWTDTLADDNNHAMANLGQLKRTFSLDLNSDADSDGLTNLAELLANKQRGEASGRGILSWTDLGNADSNGDGVSDGVEVANGTDPSTSDSDGDGVPNKDDKYPKDNRRSKDVPLKFYAVIDLSKDIPSTLRTSFDVRYIALDDNHKIAFYGKSAATAGDFKAHVYDWNAGKLTELKSFSLDYPSGTVGTGYSSRMEASDLWVFEHYHGLAVEGYAHSTLGVSGVNPSGTLTTTTDTTYWGGFNAMGEYVEVDSGTLQSVTEWPLAHYPTPSGPVLSPRESGPATGSGTIAIDSAGNKITWENKFKYDATSTDARVGTVRYRLLYNNHEVPELSADSTVFLSPDKDSLTCYGMNNHGAFLIAGYVDDEGSPSTAKLAYKYFDADKVEDAPDGIIAMNDKHQAISRAYDETVKVWNDWFSTESLPGRWKPIPVLHMLKWTNKPKDSLDDYDTFHNALSNIQPKYISDADPATAGAVIAGKTYSQGVPKQVYFTADAAATNPADPNDTTYTENGAFLLEFDKTGTNPTDWHYVIREASNPPAWSVNPSAMNATASFVGFGKQAVADPTVPVLLLPVEMMVDGNRDGQMSFDNSGPDQTSAAKPYRFWLNNDYDKGATVDFNDWEEDDYTGDHDRNDDVIEWRRDLEDFTRLWISFKGITEMVKQSGFQVKLEWKPAEGDSWTTADGNPGIRVFKAVEQDGRRQYLEDEGVAWTQIDGVQGSGNHNNFSKALGSGGLVTRTGALELPAAFLSDLSESQPYKYLLFEGYSAGKGRLILTLHKGGQKIGEYPAVYLELKDVKEMYERYTVGDAQNTGIDWSVWPAATPTQVPAPSGQPFAPPYDETEDYILFVHGWNMSPFDKEAFGDTAFKRLWHRGFKGRFGIFRWPTFHTLTVNSALAHFDASEQRAWNSGQGLLSLLQGLNGQKFAGRVRVMGHSMGNVVAGSALRLASNQRVVHTYVASQAAIPAHCYNAAAPQMPFNNGQPKTTPNVYGYFWSLGTTLDPDQYEGAGYPSFLAPGAVQGAAGKFVNYFNPADWALGLWQIDQQTKPNGGYNYFWNPLNVPGGRRGFIYDPVNPQAFRALLFPQDTYEIFSYAAEAHSFALGRSTTIGGVFDNTAEIDLNARWSFGGQHKGHSGQFRSTNMKRWQYWDELLGSFGIRQP